MENVKKAPISPAAPEDVMSKNRCVEVRFRGRQGESFAHRRKSLKRNIIWLPDGVEAEKIYKAAQKSCPGSGIEVELKHSAQYSPLYRNISRRRRNLFG